MKQITFVISLFLLNFNLMGQNHIEPMMCEGPLPNDLKQTISDIVSKNKKNNFKKNSLLAVYDIFASGKVVYGNKSWQLINAIGKRIIEKNQLDTNVRFYLLRSQSFNAFATSEGYIFATTSLLANIQTEDELAFILCHELSHFLLEHSLKEQINIKLKLSEIRKQKQNSKSSTEAKLVTYDDLLKNYYAFSRSQELEADSLGMVLFLRSGYDARSAVKALRNLEYSHPLFMNEKFEAHIFESGYKSQYEINRFDSCFIDLSKDSELIKESTLNTYNEIENINYDLDFSTHPNWTSRVELIDRILKTTNHSSVEPTAISLDIQQQCLSEMILTEYLFSNYFQSLTYLHILEKKFPENKDINRMKGACLSAIYLLKKATPKQKPPIEINHKNSCLSDLMFHTLVIGFDQLRYLALYYNNIDEGTEGFNRMCGHYSIKILKFSDYQSNFNTTETYYIKHCDSITTFTAHHPIMSKVRAYIMGMDPAIFSENYKAYSMILGSRNIHNTSDEYPISSNQEYSDSIILLSPSFLVKPGRHTKKFRNPIFRNSNTMFIEREMLRYGQRNNIYFHSISFDNKAILNTDQYNLNYLMLQMLYEFIVVNKNDYKCPINVLYNREIIKKTGCKKVQFVQFYHSRNSYFKPLMFLMDVYALPFSFFSTLDISGLVRGMFINTSTATVVLDLESCQLDFIAINNSSAKPDKNGISALTQKLISDTKQYIIRIR